MTLSYVVPAIVTPSQCHSGVTASRSNMGRTSHAAVGSIKHWPVAPSTASQ